MNLLHKIAGTAADSGVLTLSAAAPSGARMKRIGLAVAMSILTIAAGAGTASPAAAAAVVIRETFTSTGSASGLLDDCRPGITGTISGPEVVDLQRVTTPTGFHIDGTVTDTGRFDWSDGTYSNIGEVNHFSFTTGMQTTVYTNAHADFVDIYSATGVFLKRDTFHLVERITESGGVTRVQFERGHFQTFGGC